METPCKYEALLRERITQLRVQKNISEHRMSLDLGKSGSYIRSISSGASLPSMKELFNIISYFDMTPAEFFNGLETNDSPRSHLIHRLMELSEEDIEKITLFIEWIKR